MKKKPAESTKLSYTRINHEVSDKLYVQIIQKKGVDIRYRAADYSALKLSADLHTNPRYISVVVALHTGGNYSALVNGYRLRDACRMLRSPRYRDYTVEEIGLECGFASRQAFYLAFHRLYKVTPRQYRLKGAK